MDGTSWLRSLGGPPAEAREPEWLDVLIYAQEQHPAPGAAAQWLADELGVSRRSGERYLALGQQPTQRARAASERLRDDIRDAWAEADAAEARQQVADLLRLIRSVEPGRVEVVDISDGRGMKSVRSIQGSLDVDLEAVASAWEDEDDQAAADALSDAIIRAYGDKGDVDELDANLMITDYLDGIDYA